MPENEIRQIMINGRLIGISGLDEAINKIAEMQRGYTDDEIQKRLLELILLHNYIPANMQDAYGKAVLREFKIARGLSVVPEHVPRELRIAVLGMGCARCSQLESDVRDILSEMGIAADLRHVTDFKEIAGYGVMGSPALVINDKLVSAGEVPPKSKIRKWIIEVYSPTNLTE
ncbi:MAG: thioredoxin family protein [Smithellaceae bacterium]